MIYPISRRITILTGEVHSGKTTFLQHWLIDKKDPRGILTPVEEGKRIFLDIATGLRFPMEAEGNEESISVGKYQFSKSAFAKAKEIILAARFLPGILIIDELGPLELREKGFFDVVKKLLATENDQQQLLLVTRKSLLEEMREKFGWEEGSEILLKKE
jgi:nucleoside-triphosphatase THEP1